MRVLVLGGTGEARELADRLRGVPGIAVVTSLAGRVASPRLPDGAVRIGGFGGAEGLGTYLRGALIDTVVDATHPFASRITAQAVEACERCEVPLLVLRRPGWTEQAGDAWHRVRDVATAAETVATGPAGVVLLTIGRRDLAAFSADFRHDFVIRSVDPPDAGSRLPPRHIVVAARGPFTVTSELELLLARRVGQLVTKDSGGDATRAKLIAARRLGLPVVMIDRPAPPASTPTVPSPSAAARWLITRQARADRQLP